ncbi:GNAT family N-acetyltransferase [Streptomyces nogalater]
MGVHPKHRGRGLATVLLQAVVAEYAGAQIALSAEPYTPVLENWPREEGLTADTLAAWYSRHGFRAAPDEGSPSHGPRSVTHRQACV